MQPTCPCRPPAAIAPAIVWVAAVLAALALTGAIATAFVATDARDLAPRHTAAALRTTAL